jgi:hypothetical protein
MEYHLGRGIKGTRGVQREVNFLDALHRSTAQSGARAVGSSVAINPRRSFGSEALSAIRGGDGRSISAAKSSVLADFSADGLQASRDIAGRLPSWKWTANGSACPTCLSKHGNVFTGVFIPTHPSCLCVASTVESDVRPLTEGELIDMNTKYGDPRYGKLMDDLKNGRKTMADVRAVENVNAGRKGFLAVRQHNLEGIVRQRALPQSLGTRTRTSAPGEVPAPRTSAPVAVADDVADEVAEPFNFFSSKTIEGRPTKAMKNAMAEAEQIMADAVGASRGFLERGIARTERVRMQASKGKKTTQKHNGLWEERNRGPRKRRKPGEYSEPPEIIERRLSMEMNRSDFTSHNVWAKRHNEYHERISSKSIRVEDAQFSRGVVTKKPVYADNPEFIPRANNERFDAMEKWLKRNPEPSPKFAATPQQLAETLLHEIVHSLDYSTGTSIDGVLTTLRRKLKLDGIDKLAAQAYSDGDAAMWYAAKGTRGKPGETIADLTRMYFFGDRYDADQVLKTALEWRAKYPEMALWVEDNVLTLI